MLFNQINSLYHSLLDLLCHHPQVQRIVICLIQRGIPNHSHVWSQLIRVNQIINKFLTIIKFLIITIMNDLPLFLSVYVDAPITIGTLYIGSFEIFYGYTWAVLYVMVITMKFMPKQH